MNVDGARPGGGSAPTARPEPVDFRSGTAVLAPSGAKARVRANIAAITVLHTLTEQDRYATATEQDILGRWSGWGAAPQIFDARRADWASEREQLRELLDDDAWGQAQRNTLNAHYTDPAIAAAMWDAVMRAGFDGGRVLEPGCGSGTFLAHAPNSAQMVGVELDRTTAAIAAALYPSAQIRAEGFEHTHVPERSFTAAIGNVPFGDFRVHDPAHNPSRHNIHNHFILKSLALTAPGGYVAVITSRFTMDAENARARRDIADLADIVGAVRLPSSAFHRVAGTSVVTDIVMLRRREEGRRPSAETTRFCELDTATALGSDGEDRGVRINALYVDHPDRILGTLVTGTGMYGADTLGVDGEAGDVLTGRIAESLTSLIDAARAAGLGHTATWNDTLGPTAEDFQRGLSTITGPVENVAVGTLRHDPVGAAITAWTGNGWEPVKTRGAKQVVEWAALLGLRDTTAALIDSQRGDTSSSAERQALRSVLTEQYDTYVARYGPINRFTWVIPHDLTDAQHTKAVAKLEEKWRKSEGTEGEPYSEDIPDHIAEDISDRAWINPRSPRKNYAHIGKALTQDPTFATVLALEHFDETTMAARKAELFHADVLGARTAATSAETIDDAMAISLDEHARLDLPRIGELLGIDVEKVPDLMEGKAFRTLTDPQRWVPATTYLSGNVRRKLTDAIEVAAADPRYRSNVSALETVVPQRKTDVDVRPGAPWVPIEIYTQFVRDTFGVPAGTHISVERAAGTWSVEVGYFDGQGQQNLAWGLVPKRYRDSSYFNFEHPHAENLGVDNAGVSRTEYDYTKLLTDLLNNKSIVIKTSEDYRDNAAVGTVHEAASRAMQSKGRRLSQEFTQWALYTDDARRELLLDIYNEKFNSVVAPVYDGSGRQFPGLGAHFSPRRYQAAAATRIVSEPTVLLDHVVGAGKTGTILMGAMELTRLGLTRKPWIVVPNHIIDQVVREAGQWYPGARILSGSAATDTAGRRLFIAQSASQDWDMVIVPLSAFKRIGVANGTKAEFIRNQVDELEQQRSAVSNDASVKAIKKAKANLEERLEKTLDQDSKDPGLTFEASGCDYLFVDEAHMFKNLARASDVQELANSGSDQAMDLMMKLGHLRSMRREEAAARGITADEYVERVATFATGTPVANSLAELWVMQKYLRPDLLDDAGVDSIGDWGATFTDTVERVELNSSGSRLRAVTRVGEFTNVGDLVGMTSVYTDSVTRAQVELEMPGKSLPRKDTGRNIDVLFSPSVEVQDFIADLGHRADKADRTRPDIDNALKIANDGRNASLDAVAAHLDPSPPQHSRAHIVAQKILEVHEQTKDNRYLDTFGEQHPTPGGVQIVFCDRGTPKTDGSWSIYDAITDELTRAVIDEDGAELVPRIDRSKIAFVHHFPKPADKARLFDKCRTGEIAVLLGSTEKMGTGTNIQARAVALHHVDVPWRPADLEQREGRIIRQGNQNEQVRLFNYVAERTFDTVMWQTVHRKAHFIEQLKNADRSMRRVADLDSDSLADGAAMTKALATGDDRYIRQIELDSRLQELQSQADTHFAEQRSTQRDRDRLRGEVPAARERLAALDAAVPVLLARRDSESYRLTVDGSVYTDRSAAAHALVDVLQKAYNTLKGAGFSASVVVGEMSGHPLTASRPASNNELWVGFGDLAVPPKILSALDLHGSVAQNASGQHVGGVLSRIENLAGSAQTAQGQTAMRLDRDQARLAHLETVHAADFPHARQLQDLHDQVFRLRREIRESETSPEALARDSARTERLGANGREPGWSLMLNPTPALVEDLGFETADDVRHMMDRQRWAAQQNPSTTTAPAALSQSGTDAPTAGTSGTATDTLVGEHPPSERPIGYFLRAAEPTREPSTDGAAPPPPGHDGEPGRGHDRDVGMEGPM